MERPIPFTAPMVRALLEGRKTQTRRIVKGQPLWLHTHVTPVPPYGPFYLDIYAVLNCKYISAGEAWSKDGMNRCAVLSDQGRLVKCPYGLRGDRLWVRETWAADTSYDSYPPRDLTPNVGSLWFAAGGGRKFEHNERGRVRSSMFMPRWASRITLEITEVRVQRLQEISEEDAEAEGADPVAEEVSSHPSIRYRAAFHSVWLSINGTGSWGANPWVWAVTFKETA